MYPGLSFSSPELDMCWLVGIGTIGMWLREMKRDGSGIGPWDADAHYSRIPRSRIPVPLRWPSVTVTTSDALCTEQSESELLHVSYHPPIDMHPAKKEFTRSPESTSTIPKTNTSMSMSTSPGHSVLNKSQPPAPSPNETGSRSLDIPVPPHRNLRTANCKRCILPARAHARTRLGRGVP
jgi:hypothetical protein